MENEHPVGFEFVAADKRGNPMTYDEALSAAVEGMRVRCASMPEGGYVEHSFSRGFLRCWPVEKVEDEWQRTQCDFRASEAETQAEWFELERPKVDSWGKPINPAAFAAEQTALREAPAEEVKPQRSKWGQQSTEAATIAARQKVGQAWGTVIEFCGGCDRDKSACVCPAPSAEKPANKWGTGR